MSAAALASFTAEEVAVEFGVIPRTVRAWIRRGLPARKTGRPPRWRIDAAKAGPWIAANGPPGVGAGITGLAIAAPPDAKDADPPAANLNDEADVERGIEKHIDRLDLILEAFTDLLFTAQEFDPRLVTSVKLISAELRRLEVHRLEMRQADDKLMDRADHARILSTFARYVVDEIGAWARSTPDAIVDALTAAGVKLKAQRVIKSLDRVLETGEAQYISRNGKTLKIVAIAPPGRRYWDGPCDVVTSLSIDELASISWADAWTPDDT